MRDNSIGPPCLQYPSASSLYLRRSDSFWTKLGPYGPPHRRAKAKSLRQHTYRFSTTIPRDAMVAPGPKA